MREQPLTLDKNTPLATSQLPHIRIARYLSAILSPIVISIPAVFLVALSQAANQYTALGYTALTLFFLSVGPMIYIAIGVKMGKLSDLDVSKRSQRTGPFLFGLSSALLGLIALALTRAPRALQSVLLATIIIGVILLIITVWWKISMHAASLSGALTILTIIYGAICLPAYVLLLLVCWSRVILRRHTTGQVIAGSIAGVLLPWLLLTCIGF
ncbi:PAP2 superfamily protein [Thermosporothrix hazakensis]|jgi:membrane-associated phospholipid phosphatase|uniref:PAP2 superfamily protein n=1 Tax=Thermosporothrix hazakensis TaxID=644383 RepID=A0A326UEQ2_THEHA|nr:phosphatase PAP2 family protein [Thermosporothrix hazakensis]PZW36776.1 PAP2 superfamily protein [Thermosporothrix hazakensis]GCE47426.1 hypothetical protein KTH_22950 [Thermosporothrix hazakensis]